MTTRTRWLISFCWIAAVLLAFFAADASSVRSWMYLTTVALVPPVVVNGLWRTPSQTIAEAIREGEVVTVAIDTEEQARQTRWLEWQAAGARANLRSAAQAKIVAGVALSLAAAFLLMQFFASPRVV